MRDSSKIRPLSAAPCAGRAICARRRGDLRARRRGARAGFTLIEVLIGGLIMTLVGLGLMTLIRSSYDSQYELMNQNTANTRCREAVDFLADNLRGATSVTAATSASITWVDASGNQVRYWIGSGALKSSVNGAPAAGTVIVSGLTALTFTYWVWTGAAWASTTTPADVTKIGAIDIAVTVGFRDATRKLQSSVKIRQRRF